MIYMYTRMYKLVDLFLSSPYHRHLPFPCLRHVTRSLGAAAVIQNPPGNPRGHKTRKSCKGLERSPRSELQCACIWHQGFLLLGQNVKETRVFIFFPDSLPRSSTGPAGLGFFLSFSVWPILIFGNCYPPPDCHSAGR